MKRPDAWLESSKTVRVYRRAARCAVLGPGIRFVVWVQGCPFSCDGCDTPDAIPFEGGEALRVDALAEEIRECEAIEGVTFSGGEPMSQARALSTLVDRVRAHRDLSFMSYTGYEYEDLLRRGTLWQRRLLERLDFLVDGPYIRNRHTDLKWRGSDNQRIHFLTDRCRHLESTVDERGTWIELEAAEDGSVRWAGIPPPRFQEAFRKGLAELGIDLVQTEDPES